VSHITLFPAVALAWDEAAPSGRVYDVIGPVIGSGNLLPAGAALDILRQLRRNFIPALAADRDRSAETVDGALTEAVAAVERRDIARADAALRESQSVRWEPASAWREELHRHLNTNIAYVFGLLGRSDQLDDADVTGGIGTSLGFDEYVWEYPGVTPRSTTDLTALIHHTAIGFVGTVDDVSLELADRARDDTRTRLRLRPKEALWGISPESSETSIEVWLRGVVYQPLRGVGQRSPVGPADAAFGLRPGDTVFVAANRFEKPGSSMNGQLCVADLNAFARINNGRVRPGPTNSSEWIDAVVGQGAALGTAQPSADQATLFLAALREAVRTSAK
jgi:hypothetical protein